MTTYYEMLKIQPTASAVEVETAIEEQYNQWRRLVNHHDANVINQANMALSTLETIRATLTDPSRRSAYDAGIGLGGTMGGLADLSVILQSLGPTMTPPMPGFPKPTGTPPAATASSSLWTCPKPECRADNPPHTRYCFKCGTELVRQCPECSAITSLVATKMCGACGYNYDVAAQRRDLRARTSVLQTEIQGLKAQSETVKASKVEARGGPLAGVIAVLGIVWGASQGNLFGWIIGIIALGGFIWLQRRSESAKRSEIHDLDQSLGAKSQELDASEQAYQRLALHKTGE
ncbi:MAG: zinc ribbon domain-containing protein [Anaerolineae bacterium]